MKMEDTEALGW